MPIRVPKARTNEELLAEYDWLALYFKQKVRPGSHDYSERVCGSYAEALIYYQLTGFLLEPQFKPSWLDLEPVLNLFQIAPPHVQENIEDLVGEWKKRCFGEDDRIETWIPPDLDRIVEEEKEIDTLYTHYTGMFGGS